MKKQNINPNRNQSNASNQKLIGWLDDFGKHLHSRKANQNGLQQQISTLSKAYDQAQHKLLQTQKSLMNETTFADKQRSIIQILKHILIGNLEDSSILTFIAKLEEDSDPKHQIKCELIEIKKILNQRKTKKKNQISINELKKQMSKIDDQRKSLMQDMQELIINNDRLEDQLKQLNKQNQELNHKIVLLNQTNLKLSTFNHKLQQELCQNNIESTLLKQKYEKINNQFNKLRVALQQAFITFQIKKHQQNNTIKIQQIELGINTMVKKIKKYRQKLKQTKKQQKQESFMMRQVSLMKQFLSEQAIQLFKQLQNNKQQCIERQILQLARLQRDRYKKLEECEQKIWKYKIRLMQQQQYQSSSKKQCNRSTSYLFGKAKPQKNENIQIKQFVE